MTYASLKVYVDEGVETEARVALGCDLAVRFDTRLIGIAASLPDAPQVDPYAGEGSAPHSNARCCFGEWRLGEARGQRLLLG